MLLIFSVINNLWVLFIQYMFIEDLLCAEDIVVVKTDMDSLKIGARVEEGNTLIFKTPDI